jgi:hypothetical protein
MDSFFWPRFVSAGLWLDRAIYSPLFLPIPLRHPPNPFSQREQHLHRYCDEFSFRWNERKVSEAIALSVGPRLMYKEPIRRYMAELQPSNKSI